MSFWEPIKEAATSGSYPFKGIIYFLCHRELWKSLTSQLLSLLGLSTVVIMLMFFFIFIPQCLVLLFFGGPIALISTTIFVFFESASMIAFLSREYAIVDALIDLFDAVLLKEGLATLVQNGREVRSGSEQYLLLKMGKLTFGVLMRCFLHLLLNFIPLLGVLVFLLVQGLVMLVILLVKGRKLGPTYHSRYFQLKGWSDRQQEAFVAQNKLAYIGFGMVAMLLQLIPILSIFFSYTNTVGAALWAADIERRRRLE